MEYLQEDNLQERLITIFPEVNDWIRNKNFPHTRFRPDYRSKQLKMIIEFDGPMHYTDSRCIIRDNIKDKLFKECGYEVIRIPFFIQLDPRIIKKLFKKDIEIEYNYPQGFISDDKSLVYPANFCELGLRRFMEDLDKFKEVKDEIIESLKRKVIKEGDKYIVLPPSLLYILND